MIDRKELKQNAREAIKTTRPSAIWVTLMALVILAVTQVLSLSLSGDLDAYRAMYESAMNGRLVYIQATGEISMFAWLLTMALDIMSLVVSVGYALYCLRLNRRQNPGFGDVFDAFGVFFRAVWISILRSVVVSLWSFAYALPAVLLSTVMDPVLASVLCLPFFAPMFIAAYTYRFAEFIMLDNPRLACVQCMSLSRIATKGWRWELFKLDLSFLGWLLLSIIPFVILWVRPYMTVALAGFYDKVTPDAMEELKKRSVPQTRFTNAGGGWHTPGGDRDEDDDGDSGWHMPGGWDEDDDRGDF